MKSGSVVLCCAGGAGEAAGQRCAAGPGAARRDGSGRRSRQEARDGGQQQARGRPLLAPQRAHGSRRLRQHDQPLLALKSRLSMRMALPSMHAG